MRKLTAQEKEALKKKLKEAGMDEEGGQETEKKQLTDEEKEKMKEKIAQAEHERLSKMDKLLHSRSKKKEK